ncbi:MAG: tetratricopeptide repeat protein [Magnetococcales bacterium]|nr:tetratricopeptide repeat protein [Magnetococcales bacterium]
MGSGADGFGRRSLAAFVLLGVVALGVAGNPIAAGADSPVSGNAPPPVPGTLGSPAKGGGKGDPVADASGHAALAKEALAAQDPAKALEHFLAAHRLAPGNQDYPHSAGLLAAELGRNEVAVAMFKAAAKLAAVASHREDLLLYDQEIIRLQSELPGALQGKAEAAAALPAGKEAEAGQWAGLREEMTVAQGQGDLTLALEKGRQALGVAKSGLGGGHLAVFVSGRELAALLLAMGQVDAAVPVLAEALEAGGRILGKDHPETLSVRGMQAEVAEAALKFDDAARIHGEVVAVLSRELGEGHPLTLAAGVAQARNLANQGEDRGAEFLFAKVCPKLDEILGGYHPEAALCWSQAAALSLRLGDLPESRRRQGRVLAIFTATHGDDAPETLDGVVALAELDRREGRYAEAEKSLNAVLPKLAGAALEPRLRAAQAALAAVLVDLGRFAEAEKLFGEVEAFEKATLGPDHPNRLTTLDALAGVRRQMGRLRAAEADYIQVLDGFRKRYGPDNQATIVAMNNLGLVLEAEGLYDRAEPLFRGAVGGAERLLGETHPTTVASLNNLALLHESQGNFDKADPLYRRAIKSFSEKMGADHPDTVAFVNNLAYLALLDNRPKDAEPLFAEVLASWRRSLGDKHPKTLKGMNNLGRVKRLLGALEEAEKLIGEALAGRRQVLGEHHPDTLRSMLDLGTLDHSRGRLEVAAKRLRETLDLAVKHLGPQHPYTFEIRNALGALLRDQKKIPEAFQLLKEGFEERSRFLDRVLWVTGENAREGYLRLHHPELDAYLDLLTALERPVGGRELLRVGLQRKGILLDVASRQQQVVSLGQDPKLKEIAAKLTEARKSLAALTLSGPTAESAAAHLEKLRRLEEEVDRRQLELGQASVRFRESVADVTVEKLVGSLPADAALVDFLVTGPEGKEKLLAAILRREGPREVIDLVVYPELAAINEAVMEYRQVIQDEDADEDQILEQGEVVHDLLWKPLKSALGGRTKVYVVPDGALNILPFNAMVDGEGEYLIRSVDLHVLSSSRDLIPTRVPQSQGGGVDPGGAGLRFGRGRRRGGVGRCSASAFGRLHPDGGGGAGQGRRGAGGGADEARGGIGGGLSFPGGGSLPGDGGAFPGDGGPLPRHAWVAFRSPAGSGEGGAFDHRRGREAEAGESDLFEERGRGGLHPGAGEVPGGFSYCHPWLFPEG